VKVREGGDPKGERVQIGAAPDPHSPFPEHSPLAAHEVYPGESVPGAGIITGMGCIPHPAASVSFSAGEEILVGSGGHPGARFTLCTVPHNSSPQCQTYHMNTVLLPGLTRALPVPSAFSDLPPFLLPDAPLPMLPFSPERFRYATVLLELDLNSLDSQVIKVSNAHGISTGQL